MLARYDMVVAMNVLAHVPDPLAFLKGVEKVLAPGGVCVVQVSQARMLDTGEFDAIYHEHVSYFTPESMDVLAARTGLEFWFFRGTKVHGGSVVYMLRRSGDDIALPSDFLESGEFEEPFQTSWLDRSAEYERFADTASIAIDEIRQLMRNNEYDRRPVAFVGAAAKAIVVMHATGAKPDLIVDEAPLKIGRWIPEVDRQILPLAEYGNHQRRFAGRDLRMGIATKPRRGRRQCAATSLPSFSRIFRRSSDGAHRPANRSVSLHRQVCNGRSLLCDLPTYARRSGTLAAND